MDVKLRCKQKIPVFTFALFSIKACNASTLWRFVMIIAQVNLFYAMTLDLEVYPNCIILGSATKT